MKKQFIVGLGGKGVPVRKGTFANRIVNQKSICKTKIELDKLLQAQIKIFWEENNNEKTKI